MAYLAAFFGLIVVVRMLIVGGASADGKGFRRENQPGAFWTIVVVAIIVDLLLFFIAISGKVPDWIMVTGR